MPKPFLLFVKTEGAVMLKQAVFDVLELVCLALFLGAIFALSLAI